MSGQAAHIEGKVHARRPQEGALCLNVLRLGAKVLQSSESVKICTYVENEKALVALKQ